ncbi:hypothetical protein GCM10022410_25800 [Amphibacillus indicireducens]|uniref:Aminoglycoside 6-adenylyltransferase n=1 Tax=Amphibacillus indicireducens TaxID=1076330 RepID=A0ABP7W4F6_9BACI
MLVPVEDQVEYIGEDTLTKILLDKDQSLPEIPVATDQDYWVKKPTDQQYLDCCNEFWWITTYIAKGLWREEMLYALDHLNRYCRPMLYQMLAWQVGFETDFSVSVGKSEKYLANYLEKDTWERVLNTFPRASYADVWKALFAMIELFRDTAAFIAERLDFDYPVGWDQRVSAYLNQVKGLPKNATEFTK